MRLGNTLNTGVSFDLQVRNHVGYNKAIKQLDTTKCKWLLIRTGGVI